MRLQSRMGMGLFLSSLILSGCGVDATEDEGKVAEVQQSIIPGYWTSEVSEEVAPIGCANGYVVDAMSCRGGWCDNMRLHCGWKALTVSNAGWTSYFSEEGNNARVCPENQFMVGMACSGGWCDNIGLQCATFAGKGRSTDCYWSPYFSEEQGYMYLQSSYYAAGLRCRGGWCDDLSIYACRLS